MSLFPPASTAREEEEVEEVCALSIPHHHQKCEHNLREAYSHGRRRVGKSGDRIRTRWGVFAVVVVVVALESMEEESLPLQTPSLRRAKPSMREDVVVSFSWFLDRPPPRRRVLESRLEQSGNPFANQTRIPPLQSHHNIKAHIVHRSKSRTPAPTSTPFKSSNRMHNRRKSGNLPPTPPNRAFNRRV